MAINTLGRISVVGTSIVGGDSAGNIMISTGEGMELKGFDIFNYDNAVPSLTIGDFSRESIFATQRIFYKCATTILNTGEDTVVSFADVNYNDDSVNTYISFASRPFFTGFGNTINHVYGFLNAPQYNVMGIFDEGKGFVNSPEVLAGVNVSTVHGVHLLDTAGTGTVTNQYGLVIDTLTKGSAKNVAIKVGNTPADQNIIEVAAPDTPTFGWDNTNSEFTFSKPVSIPGQPKLLIHTLMYNQTGIQYVARPFGKALVWGLLVRVDVPFNDSGTDTFMMGHQYSYDYFVPSSTTVDTPKTINSAVPCPWYSAGAYDISAEYTGQNGDATAGQLTIYIYYTPLD